jgi:DNA-binding response OmpR family regulator
MSQRILIIDDEDLMRESLAVFLRSRGYEVFTASGSEAGLVVLAKETVQLVLLDVGLGDGDGLEILSTIKQNWPLTAVIILTGMGWDDGLRQEAQRKGADSFLVKGIPVNEFMDIVHRCLDQQRDA